MFKLYDVLKKPEKSYHGGETMVQTSRQTITSLATATLCVVIGVMALLFAVYYVNAVNNQNQSNNRLATLQTENNNLQSEIATRNTQISTLNTEVTSLSTEVTSLTAQANTLSTQNQNLQTQVNSLSQTADTLASELAQMEAAGQSGGGGGRIPYMW